MEVVGNILARFKRRQLRLGLLTLQEQAPRAGPHLTFKKHKKAMNVLQKKYKEARKVRMRSRRCGCALHALDV